jgi:hypothetical protein
MTSQKQKALELALRFCSPSDVIKPNPASIRNATKCVDEKIKLFNRLCGSQSWYWTSDEHDTYKELIEVKKEIELL